MDCSHIPKTSGLAQGICGFLHKAEDLPKHLAVPLGTISKDPAHTPSSAIKTLQPNHCVQCHASLTTLPCSSRLPAGLTVALVHSALIAWSKPTSIPFPLTLFYFSSKHASLPDIIQSTCLLVCHLLPNGRNKVCPVAATYSKSSAYAVEQ